jgi:hypothetical protein
VVIEGGFTCPMNLVPAYRSGNVGICTEGHTSIEEIPRKVCTDAGLASCAVLEPVSPIPPMEDPKEDPKSEEGLERADCDAFDPATLTTSATDADCDVNTPDSCPQGTHLFYTDDSACAVCVKDTEQNRTCEWAEACVEPFLETVAHSSGAKRCDSASDCYTFTISAGCGPTLEMSLTGSIDEEVTWIAEIYGQQSCSLCQDAQAPSFAFSDRAPACVDRICTFE